MNHHGLAVWLTGLPCSGKSTLAQLLCARLMEQGYAVEILDGDEVRQWLTPQLGYSRADRDENIRRIARVAQLLTRVGAVVLVAVVSPYRSTREEARALIGNFVEVFVDSPLEVCIQRDVKGMYRKALNGELAHFTGVSDPYEPPPHPEVVVRTNLEGPQESTDKILSALARLGYARHLVR
ncbi:MAG: adenylyl-sulfate kinase [Candidatus Omnitrophica bacterium]|nr:adenylyl-sulfate kinase [Candidatus Omnitrophota bacterium]